MYNGTMINHLFLLVFFIELNLIQSLVTTLIVIQFEFKVSSHVLKQNALHSIEVYPE